MARRQWGDWFNVDAWLKWAAVWDFCSGSWFASGWLCVRLRARPCARWALGESESARAHFVGPHNKIQLFNKWEWKLESVPSRGGYHFLRRCTLFARTGIPIILLHYRRNLPSVPTTSDRSYPSINRTTASQLLTGEVIIIIILSLMCHAGRTHMSTRLLLKIIGHILNQ